jgi:hypothetical protein
MLFQDTLSRAPNIIIRSFQDGEADWNCALNSKIKKNSKKIKKRKLNNKLH